MIRSNTPQPSLDFDRQLSPRLGKLAFFNLKKVLIACFFSVISACYEGWEDPNVAGPSGKDQSEPDPSANGPKKYVYILLTSIRPDLGALNSAQCFPSADIKEYKNVEFNERIAELTAALSVITEKLVTKAVPISSTDCTKLDTVRVEASKLEPWTPEPPPQSDSLNRLTLHVKAAFWHGDPSASPPVGVVSEDWSALTAIKSKGIRSKSITYHVISGGGAGYFSSWSKALPKNAFKGGNPLNKIDPSPNGIEARRQAIKQDTIQLIQWMTESAQ
jgi:hypothetical protein